MLALIIIGMFLDGVSTFLILVPILLPIAKTYGWDLVWFGVILTMKLPSASSRLRSPSI